MSFAGRDEVVANLQIVTVDADFAVDQRAATRVIRQTQRDFRFARH
jgi:hypothetical protein